MSSTMRAAVVCAAAVLAAVVAPAAAQSSMRAVGSHAAVGAGTFGPGCTTGGSEFCDQRSFSFRLAAVSVFSGSTAFGYFSRTNVANGNTFAGVVTCLSVTGNAAAVGGFVTQPGPPTPFLVYVSDNGGGIDGISPFFLIGPDEPSPAPGFPFACPSSQSTLGYYGLTSGEVIVR